jgi:hypothetical protein
VEFDHNKWREAYLLSRATAVTGQALTAAATAPSLARLFGSILSEMKLWLYRDGLSPLLTDSSHLEGQPFKFEPYKVKQTFETNLQAVSSVYLDTKFSPASAEKASVRRFSTAVMPKNFSNVVGIKESEIQKWLDKKELSKIPGYDTPPLFLPSFSVVHSPLLGDPVSFNLSLHRNLAQVLQAFAALPESEDPSTLTQFFADPSYLLCDLKDVSFVTGTESMSPEDVITLRSFFSGNIAAVKTVHAIADFPLRTIVAGRQIAEYRMWAKNGPYCAHFASCYASFPECKFFRDLDLLLLQFSAASTPYGLGPAGMFDLMIQRFSLLGYLDDLYCTSEKSSFVMPPKLPEPDHAEHMCAAFFSTLNMLLTELPLPPSDPIASVKHTAKFDLLHKLCLEPMTHSQCYSASIASISKEGDAPPFFQGVFAEIMQEITTLVPPSRNFPMKRYELKDELSLLYDPCYFHLAPVEHQTAMENVMRKRKKHLKKAVAPLVPCPEKAHAVFARARGMLSLEASFAAARRALLFAVLGGQWTPPNSRVSPETVSKSPKSILEVLQFLTLQMQHVIDNHNDTKHATMLVEPAYVFDGDEAFNPKGVGWFLSPKVLPTKAKFQSAKLSQRSSVLGLLIILFEHWSEKSDTDPAQSSKQATDEAEQQESSPARYLTVSGLAWLLRAASLLASGWNQIISGGEFREWSSTGIRPASVGEAKMPYVLSPASVEMLNAVDNLWPVEESAETVTFSPLVESKLRQKAAQAKAMASMKMRQAAFQATVNPDDLVEGSEEDECIICRCSNDTPTGAVAHVQRSRLAHFRNLACQDPVYGKLYRVVGEHGCQLRECIEVDSKKKTNLPTGAVVEVLRTSDEDGDANPLLKRRVCVRVFGESDPAEEGWASIESAVNYKILQAISADVGKWGSTRPFVKFCGHRAHLGCIESHTLMLHQKEANGVQFVGKHSCDLTKREFLCPACTHISNCVVPAPVPIPEERDAEPTQRDIDTVNASKSYQFTMVDSMEAPFAPHLKRRSDIFRHESIDVWDVPALMPLRSLLVSFSALSTAASMHVMNFDFGSAQVQDMRLLAGGTKALINAAHAYGRAEESPVPMLRVLVGRVFGKYSGLSFEHMGSSIVGFLSSMPVHLAKDGQLNAYSRAKAALSAAFWLEDDERLRGAFERPAEVADEKGIPVPFAANAGEEAGELARLALVTAGHTNVASVWPMLGVLNWDLAIFGSVAMCSLERAEHDCGVSAVSYEVLFRDLVLARVVQIMVLEMNGGVGSGSEDSKTGAISTARSKLLFDAELVTTASLTEDEMASVLNDKLLPYLKIFILLSRAGTPTANFLPSDSFLMDDELLESEDAYEIMETCGIESVASFVEEEENMSRAKVWIEELEALEKGHSQVAERAKNDSQVTNRPQEADVSVMTLAETDEYMGSRPRANSDAPMEDAAGSEAGGELELLGDDAVAFGRDDFRVDDFRVDDDGDDDDGDDDDAVAYDDVDAFMAGGDQDNDEDDEGIPNPNRLLLQNFMTLMNHAQRDGEEVPPDAMAEFEQAMEDNPALALLVDQLADRDRRVASERRAAAPARRRRHSFSCSQDSAPSKRTTNKSYAYVSNTPVVASGWHSISGAAKVFGTSDPVSSRSIHSSVRDVSYLSSAVTTLDFDPFIKLPTNFVDLYHYTLDVVKGLRDKESGEDDDYAAAVCMLTGKVVPLKTSGSRNHSREPGNCTVHAREHNSGIGIFFMVSRAQVLLINDKHSCYWKSLYLDAHGEEDQGLKRGRPLMLSDSRYAELKTLYAEHGVVREIAAVRQKSEHVIKDAWY